MACKCWRGTYVSDYQMPSLYAVLTFILFNDSSFFCLFRTTKYSAAAVCYFFAGIFSCGAGKEVAAAMAKEGQDAPAAQDDGDDKQDEKA